MRITHASTHNILRTALIVTAILCIGLSSMTSNCADPDLWGHVQYGREVLRDGTLPRTTTWSFAAEGAQWVNHENIAELLLAWTVDSFGMPGLPAMKLVMAIIILGLMMWSARRDECRWLAIGVTVFLVAINLQFHWHFRPQILSYVSLAAMLTIWQRAFHCSDALYCNAELPALHRQMQVLWLLPTLLCFWTNSHGGFAAGVAIMVAYHGLVSSQLLFAFGKRATTTVGLLIAVTVASLAATFLNPYGGTLWKFMLAALTLPRPEIADWGPLELWTFESMRFWMLFIIAGGGFTFVLRQHGHKILTSQFLSQSILLLLLVWQGMSHCRHLSIVAIVCGFFVPLPLHKMINYATAGLQRRVSKLTQQNANSQTRLRGLLPGNLILVAVVLLCSLKLVPQLTDVTVDRTEFPVSAMQFMHDHNLHGTVVVTFNWAQYAIGCFAEETDPERQSLVAVDGRFETCYPREITDIYFDFWLGTDDPKQRYRSPHAPPFDPARALNFHQPDLVLLSREQGPSVREMQKHTSDWAILYQDSMAQLWGRKSVYDVADSRQYFAPARRHISDDIQAGAVSWPAFPVAAHPRDRLTSGNSRTVKHGSYSATYFAIQSAVHQSSRPE